MALTDLIAGRDGDAAFLGPHGAEATYGQIRGTIRAVQDALKAWAGDNAPIIATLMPDHPGTALTLLALCEQAVAAPLNPSLTEDELRAGLDRTGAQALLATDGDARAATLAQAVGLPLLTLTQGAAHFADFRLQVPFAPAPERPADDLSMILSTSGSTGTPKGVPLTETMLRHSTKAIADHLALGPSDCALHMLPMFHVGAVVDLLLVPLSAGGRIRFAHPIATENLASALRIGDATWLQAVPTMLARLLADAPDMSATGLRFIRSVSADLAPSLQAEVEERLGAPIVQMYGMTETAGQITSNPVPPARGTPGAVGKPAGAEVRIMDRQGNPLPDGTEGEVCVAGPGVMPGYLGMDSADAFFGRYLRTGDLGRISREGDLFLVGRVKEIINRGGEKLAPVEIEQRLIAHKDVREAAVFAIPHPSLGEEPAAAIVGANAPDLDALRQWVGQGLAEFKVPRRILVLEALPRLGSGKVDKRALAAMASTSGAVIEDSAPFSPLEEKVAQVWMQTLNSPHPGRADDFFDAGGDSLAATSFVLALEKAVGQPLSANLLFDNPSFGDLCAALEATTPTAPARKQPEALRAARRASVHWEGRRASPEALFIGRHTAAEGQPIFFACGGIDQVSGLMDGLGTTRPVYLCRVLSKLKSRFGLPLKTAANNALLADALAAEIETLQPNGPVQLGGFCQGAVVMRLVADRLLAQGRQIGLFVLVDRFFHQPMPYPVIAGWTHRSVFSPFSHFAQAVPGVQALYPEGVRVELYDTDHMSLLKGAQGKQFAKALQDVSARGLSNLSAPGLAERKAAYSARIALKSARRAAPGQDVDVMATVTNTSATDWLPTKDSGLRLQAQWRNFDNVIRVACAADASFDRAVAPGESVTLKLAVPYPQKKLPQVLLVDMVDDGVAWFHWHGSRPGRRILLPRLA